MAKSVLKEAADTTNDIATAPTRTMTPLAAVANGMLAGAAGTLAMDIFKYLRHRQTGGESSAIDYEFMPGLRAWDQAPAPGQIGKRLYEGLLQRPLPERYAPLSSDLVHWGYGMAWGGLFGLTVGSTRLGRGVKAVAGAPFGATVFTAAYIILPLARLYKPPWDYDAKTLAKDLGTHLLYGAGVSAAFAALSRPAS